MADDIDDLLDEVETKFCARTPVKKGSSTSSSRRQDRIDGGGHDGTSKKR